MAAPSPMPALACAPRAPLVKALRERAGRRLVATASSEAQSIEVYADERGAWSLLVTKPGGPACLMASGTDWSVR